MKIIDYIANLMVALCAGYVIGLVIMAVTK
jgi:hypothetical protein